MICRTTPLDISTIPQGHSLFLEWTHLHQSKIPRLQMILQPLCQDHMGFLKMVKNHALWFYTKHFLENSKYLPPNINSWRLIRIPDDPKQGLLHWYPIIVCGTLVMQKGTAPFLLNTFTVTPSFLLGLKRYCVSPAVESHPLTWKHSFILTGSPCKGLRSKKWIKLLWNHTFPNIVTIFRENTIS